MGLLSAPYLVFMVPVVSTWLTHTRKTAYDKAGNCVPLLDGGTVSKRFAKNQAEQEGQLGGHRPRPCLAAPAPSARLVPPRAQAAPPHPSAPPEPCGSSPRPPAARLRPPPR